MATVLVLGTTARRPNLASQAKALRKRPSLVPAAPVIGTHVLDLAHDAISLRGTNDAIEYWNHAAQALYGWTAEEAIGCVSHVLLETVFPAPLERIEAHLARGGRWEGELIHTRKDGSQVTVASRWCPQRDKASGRIAVVVYEMQTAHASAVAATVAHEIRQPLTAMVASADAGLRFLDRATPDLDKAREAFRRISADGHRAGAVVQGIRENLRTAVKDRTPVDIDALILESISLERANLQRHRVIVQAEPNGYLPAVRGNRVQLQQVLLNLIANAVDAMAANVEPRVLRVKSEARAGNGVVITVADTGTGVECGNVARIFNPLFTTKAHGMGMGLAICRAIVEAHGGKLSHAPNAPRGAVFELTLCCG